MKNIEILCVFYTDSTSQFGLALFHVTGGYCIRQYCSRPGIGILFL